MSAKVINRVLSAACIPVAVLGFNLWPFFTKGFFYWALAMHFILIYTMAYRLAIGFGQPDKFVIKAMLCGVALSFNNLLDETFFEPKLIQANEYVTAAVVILIIAFGGRLINWVLKK